MKETTQSASEKLNSYLFLCKEYEEGDPTLRVKYGDTESNSPMKLNSSLKKKYIIGIRI